MPRTHGRSQLTRRRSTFPSASDLDDQDLVVARAALRFGERVGIGAFGAVHICRVEGRDGAPIVAKVVDCARMEASAMPQW